MAPSIITIDHKPILALGTPGAYGIPQIQTQVLIQHVDFGLDIQTAIEEPRARLQDGQEIMLEDRVPPSVVGGLRQRGHVVGLGPSWTTLAGAVQAVAINPATGILTGAADPRRDGEAAAL
jgi:gamma-glutamyltranspeptidase / glutathione hydrolase